MIPNLTVAFAHDTRRLLGRVLMATVIAYMLVCIIAAMFGVDVGAWLVGGSGAGMAVAAAQPQQTFAVPFPAASHRHVEPAFSLTVTPGATAQQLNPIDIPASGYFRSLLLEVTYTNGTVGVLNADGPANVFQSILLQDVNGANIFGPLDGYAAAIAHVVSGNAFKVHEQVGVADPATVIVGPNPVFSMRIPLEISQRTGLGSLANQNSAANYKLNLAINPESAITTTPWTVDPTITIKGWLEAWTLPAPQDARANPQMQVPPLLGTGMYVSTRSKAVGVGNNTVEFTRLGNLLRAVIFIARDGTGARNAGVFPDPASFTWDGNNILSQVSQRYLRTIFNESMLNTGLATMGASPSLPAGVYVLPFNTANPGGRMGDEEPDFYLPTTQSSRLEINGNSSVAGTIQVVTIEVAPYEATQAERYIQPNASGALQQPTLPTTQGN